MGFYCSISPSRSTLGFDIMLEVVPIDRRGETYTIRKDKGEGKEIQIKESCYIIIAERCPLRL